MKSKRNNNTCNICYDIFFGLNSTLCRNCIKRISLEPRISCRGLCKGKNTALSNSIFCGYCESHFIELEKEPQLKGLNDLGIVENYCNCLECPTRKSSGYIITARTFEKYLLEKYISLPQYKGILLNRVETFLRINPNLNRENIILSKIRDFIPESYQEQALNWLLLMKRGHGKFFYKTLYRGITKDMNTIVHRKQINHDTTYPIYNNFYKSFSFGWPSVEILEGLYFLYPNFEIGLMGTCEEDRRGPYGCFTKIFSRM